MAQTRNIVPIGTEEAHLHTAQDRDFHAHEPALADGDEGERGFAPRRGGALVAPVVALLLVLGWTVFFVWSLWPTMRDGAAPAQGAQWIVDWSMPVLLVLALWAVWMRSSRSEASRFAETAAHLRRESRALEERLARVNGELSIAREFLTYQSRDLESLGRVAAQRIADSAERIEAAIADNGGRAENLHAVSGAALENMERLRGQIPVLTNATRDLSNAIGLAGNTAGERVERLATGLERLGEAGEASGAKIDELRDQADDLRARIGTVGEDAAGLFAAMETDGREVLDATGARVKALSGEMSRLHGDLARQGETIEAQLAERMARSEEASRAMAEGLAVRLAEIDREIEERRQRHEEITQGLARHAQNIAGQLAEYGERMDDAASRGRAAEANVAGGLAALAERLAESREALAGTDSAVASLTQSSRRLLELVEASASHARDTLPAALHDAEGRFSGLDERAHALRDAIGEAGDRGRALGDALGSSREATRAALSEIDGLHDTMQARGAEHGEQIAELREMLRAARADSEAVAQNAQAALREAVASLTGETRAAVRSLNDDATGAVHALAGRMGEETGAAMRQAVDDSTREALERLGEAVERATGAARDAGAELGERMAQLDEITGHLEQRVAAARDRAQEDIDEHFARRVSQITESLNSTAIDIDKALSADVSDQAWQAYLRGERGIFTRRAVRLLDGAEARLVHDHYARDTEFREHVNRYIHDFEAMLRNLLITREGNSFAVTLLSSDMGKLYVALAQAIERLRK